jgi:sulfite exporter TauE/SafE
MCGGFVIAYSTAKIDEKMSKRKQFFAHFIYNTGRVFSYALIGAFFGFLGSILLISNMAFGFLYAAIGIFMILMGISLSGNLRFLTSIEVSLVKFRFFRTMFSKLIRSKTLLSFFFLGMLNGFLPCGLVYFFAASAAATGSLMWGAIVMIIFGVSTMPVLFSLGVVSGFLRNTRFRNTMVKLASVAIGLYGIYMIHKGYWFAFDPNASIHTCH